MADTKQPNDLPARLVGGFFALIGLGLLLGAFSDLSSTRHFLRSAARVPGVVSRLNAGGSHPQIQFTAASGEVVGYPQGGMIWGYRAGDRVTVLYDPRQPDSDPHLDTPGVLWFDTGMLFLLGGVFTGIGLSRALGSRTFKVRGLDG